MARKAPTSSVIKRLFAKSGNRCAYENCTNSLVDEEGNVLGEICHIEAASEKGSRYNPMSDDEDRRSFDNLILLCERHHKIVDNNPHKYTADYLKNIKESHQRNYTEDDFNIADSSVNKVIQEIEKQFVQKNSNLGNGQQYILQADTINLNTNQDKENDGTKKPTKKTIKSKIELISAILGIIALILTILSRFTAVLPNLNPYKSHLLLISTVLFMILLGHLTWAKNSDQEFQYGKKLRTYSKLGFFCLPIIYFIVWFAFMRLTKEEIIERDKLIELGNYYYDKEHLRNLALDPYRKVIEIDPSQPEIIKRIKELEE